MQARIGLKGKVWHIPSETKNCIVECPWVERGQQASTNQTFVTGVEGGHSVFTRNKVETYKSKFGAKYMELHVCRLGILSSQGGIGWCFGDVR